MKTWKKMAAILLVLTLMTGATTAALATETTDIGDGFFRYTEPITLTTCKKQETATWASAEDSQEENEATRKIRDKFNVNIKTDWISDDYYTKLSLCVASDTLPDVFMVDNEHYSLYQDMVENDMLYDMSAIYQQYASEYVKGICATYNNAPLKAITNSDGAMYGIASGNYYYDGDRYLWVRQDWLDALNMEQPKTIDDLEKVLIAFRDHYGSKGLLIGSDVAGVYGSLASLAAAFNVYLGAWIDDGSGEITYGSLDTRTKDMLGILQRWYAEGLINPEFMTTDIATNQALFASGASGTILGSWWWASGFTDILKLEGAKVSVLACPVDAQGKWNILLPATIQGILCVNKNCKNPEAVMEILNYVVNKFGDFGKDVYEKYNTEGTFWRAYYPFGAFNMVAADEIIGTYYGIQEYQKTGTLSKQYELDWLIKLVDKYLKGEKYDAEEASVFWYTYGYYYACQQMEAENVTLKEQAFSSRTASMSDFWSNLQTLETTYLQSIIIGDKEVQAYDEFIEKWKSEGGTMITEEVNELIK